MAANPVVHIEISARDPKAASEFYRELFGWEIQHDERFDYTMFETGDGPGGAFSVANENNPAGTVVIYIHSEDIDASLAKAESLGGQTILPKMEIPDTGWIGMFVDPTGNRIGLYKRMG